MTASGHELTVGQLAARSGVAVSALHFYEAKGLINSVRTPGNQRRYGRDVLRRVAFIRVSQRVGVPLAEIREALAGLPEGRTPTRADWSRLSQVWRRQLDDRIDQLLRLRDDLDDCIGCGCLSLDRCALSNPGDRLGATGTGPRRLLTEAAAAIREQEAAKAAAPERQQAAGPERTARDREDPCATIREAEAGATPEPAVTGSPDCHAEPREAHPCRIDPGHAEPRHAGPGHAEPRDARPCGDSAPRLLCTA